MKLYSLYLLGILFVFLLTWTACKTKKQTTATQAEKPVVTTPEKPKTEPTRPTRPQEPIQEKPYLMASIERTPCFGRCPHYKITVFSDGKVLYEGKRFVEKIGTYEGKIGIDKLKQIEARAKDIKYFEFADRYPTGNDHISDLPAAITYFKYQDKEKTITNRHDSPNTLREYEDFLDSILMNIEWKTISSPNDK